MTCKDFERLLEAWLVEDDSSGSGLAGTERAACTRHLAGCPRCRELAELGALAVTPVDGAGSAGSLDPGPGFVEAVLDRTSGAPRPAETPATGARGGWAGLWLRLVRRPRFAWEAAYVLTLVLAPAVLWSGASERTVALLGEAGRAGSVAVTTASQKLTTGAAERVGSLGAAAGTELRTFGTRLASSLEKGRESGPEDVNQKKGNAP